MHVELVLADLGSLSVLRGSLSHYSTNGSFPNSLHHWLQLMASPDRRLLLLQGFCEGLRAHDEGFDLCEMADVCVLAHLLVAGH